MAAPAAALAGAWVAAAPAAFAQTEPQPPLPEQQQQQEPPQGGAAGGGAGGAALQCRDDRGTVVPFANNSARIGAKAKQRLDEVAAWAREAENRSVRLEGYASKTGNPAYNERLSARRAEAVRSYLHTNGVDPMRVTSIAYGEDTPEERARLANERAVYVVECEGPQTPGVAQAPQGPIVVPVVPVPVPVPEEAPLAEEPMAEEPMAEEPTLPPPTGTELGGAAPGLAATGAEPAGPLSRIGIGGLLGGGITGFVDEEARNFTTDVGGGWEARLTFGTRLPVALEAAYVGSAQGVNALGLDGDSVLVGNGAEGTLRVNLTRAAIQPYLFGGIGWTRYDITNTDQNTSSLRNEDNTYNVPFGVGISARVARSLLLDLRGTGRAVWDDDLMDAAYTNTGREASLHTWNAAARLGWEF